MLGNGPGPTKLEAGRYAIFAFISLCLGIFLYFLSVINQPKPPALQWVEGEIASSDRVCLQTACSILIKLRMGTVDLQMSRIDTFGGGFVAPANGTHVSALIEYRSILVGVGTWSAARIWELRVGDRSVIPYSPAVSRTAAAYFYRFSIAMVACAVGVGLLVWSLSAPWRLNRAIRQVEHESRLNKAADALRESHFVQTKDRFEVGNGFKD